MGAYWAFHVGGLVSLPAYSAICEAVVWFKKNKKIKMSDMFLCLTNKCNPTDYSLVSINVKPLE